MIYLDNAATTKISPMVLEEMIPYFKTEYGNPGTVYGLGRRAADAVAQARQRVADFIGASPEQIIFTSGGSEANTITIRCTRKYLESNGKGMVLTSAVEHDSVLRAIDHIPSVSVGVDELGVVHAEHITQILDMCPDIGLVSIMYTNNETGSVNPIAEIGRVCAEHGVLFHTDCVQAAGCQPIDVSAIGCDFLSLSSHKIHGAKGVGALFVKNKELLTPQIYGGALQEFGLRSGTENVAGIVGFGKACELAGHGREKRLKTVSNYKQKFYDCLIRELREGNLDKIVSINGEPITNKGKTLNLRLEDVDAETLLLMLDAQGVCISAGSACRSHESHPSHVLTAMGLTPDQARDSVRVSFSEFNKSCDVIEAAKIMAECIISLRRGEL
ncbi:MAG: cysteine desulfurase [Ruminococcus sp.]|nr:cysteine desulfurase [Ruminococcus sp.]